MTSIENFPDFKARKRLLHGKFKNKKRGPSPGPPLFVAVLPLTSGPLVAPIHVVDTVDEALVTGRVRPNYNASGHIVKI